MKRYEKIRQILDLNSEGLLSDNNTITAISKIVQVAKEPVTAHQRRRRIKFSHWSDLDKQLLVKSHKQGIPLSIIAKNLGRTLGATNFQLMQLREKGAI
jgi:hypothetical protein